ncbi:hypothetical protein HDU97_004399 [Phlyctochytrium planicorne]|nr:hypothetical protein HDU97_004399 [Phlyctochytrium planicorne]
MTPISDTEVVGNSALQIQNSMRRDGPGAGQASSSGRRLSVDGFGILDHPVQPIQANFLDQGGLVRPEDMAAFSASPPFDFLSRAAEAQTSSVHSGRSSGSYPHSNSSYRRLSITFPQSPGATNQSTLATSTSSGVNMQAGSILGNLQGVLFTPNSSQHAGYGSLLANAARMSPPPLVTMGSSHISQLPLAGGESQSGMKRLEAVLSAELDGMKTAEAKRRSLQQQQSRRGSINSHRFSLDSNHSLGNSFISSGSEISLAKRSSSSKLALARYQQLKDANTYFVESIGSVNSPNLRNSVKASPTLNPGSSPIQSSPSLVAGSPVAKPSQHSPLEFPSAIFAHTSALHSTKQVPHLQAEHQLSKVYEASDISEVEALEEQPRGLDDSISGLKFEDLGAEEAEGSDEGLRNETHLDSQEQIEQRKYTTSFASLKPPVMPFLNSALNMIGNIASTTRKSGSVGAHSTPNQKVIVSEPARVSSGFTPTSSISTHSGIKNEQSEGTGSTAGGGSTASSMTSSAKSSLSLSIRSAGESIGSAMGQSNGGSGILPQRMVSPLLSDSRLKGSGGVIGGRGFGTFFPSAAITDALDVSHLARPGTHHVRERPHSQTFSMGHGGLASSAGFLIKPGDPVPSHPIPVIYPHLSWTSSAAEDGAQQHRRDPLSNAGILGTHGMYHSAHLPTSAPQDTNLSTTATTSSSTTTGSANPTLRRRSSLSHLNLPSQSSQKFYLGGTSPHPPSTFYGHSASPSTGVLWNKENSADDQLDGERDNL